MRSDLALPEWDAFACEVVARPDVAIRLGPLQDPALLADTGPVGNGRMIEFSIGNVGAWSVTEGREIAIQPCRDADEGELRLFTLGSAWGALGYQRGLALLHGSAVEIDGRAMLFCGVQGRGKSTMAAAMVSRGHRLLVDDLSRVDLPQSDEPPMLFPSGPRLKLWQDAIDRFGWQRQVLARDHFRAEKYHLAVNELVLPEPVPLAAIIFLEWGDELQLERFHGARAVGAAIAACSYRPEMLAVMGLEAQQAALLARIVAATSTFRFARPRDLERLDMACELLADCVLSQVR